MKNLKKNLKSILKDESAQGATEYILLAVVVVGIVMMFKTDIMEAIRSKMDQLKGKIMAVE
ncbi:MAG: hypothetical protein HOO06_02185 [Bdellovibrionaceae bacterium]|jgi:hypothetical protein|nr:hypothetical protein [Pseudobdellovibrionaceae bacterium]